MSVTAWADSWRIMWNDGGPWSRLTLGSLTLIASDTTYRAKLSVTEKQERMGLHDMDRSQAIRAGGSGCVEGSERRKPVCAEPTVLSSRRPNCDLHGVTWVLPIQTDVVAVDNAGGADLIYEDDVD